MAKKQIAPVYVEIEPNNLWEVHAESQEGTLLGTVIHTAYAFPMSLFFPKGEYWFIPKFNKSPLDIGIGKTKEKAFTKYLDLYCDAEIRGV